MNLLDKTQVAFMRCFGGAKRPLSDTATVHADLGVVSTSTFIQRHSFVPSRIGSGFVSVGIILRVCCLSQVAKPIIIRLAIYVVNMFWRPPASHIKPREAVSIILLSQNSYQNVTYGVFPSSRRTAPLGRDKPSEVASFWIIAKKLAQITLRDKGLFGIHGKGHPSGTDRTVIKSLLGSQMLSGLATLPRIAV